MGRKLFVGNLAQAVTDTTLSKVFEACGTVRSAEVVLDRHTGCSRGFALVEMATDEQARTAIKSLNLKEVEGRCITVQEDRPRTASKAPRR
jgi:cold-inducible RNA-binding protein